MQIGWITHTKFTPPRLREDFLPRSRLLEALKSAVHTRSLILLSAPPGYGKTTFLAALPAAFPHQPISWMSLDEDDNDPARFLTGLIHALQQDKPDFGGNTQALLANLLNPAGETRRIMSALINEILDNYPQTWMILDDLHTITEPKIYATLDYLLDHMPPQMRLLIGTRHDPPLSLARLRARGQLFELRAPDLRFTFEEAEIYLNDKQHFDLSADDLAILQSHAEGWIAGLLLMAGSLDQLHSANDRRVFIHNLASTDHYVFDFLAEEALQRQEPETRAFLLDTSILPELVPALCNRLTSRNDAEMMIEKLYRRNLFLIKTGEIGSTFRYHALFAEFLREQLKRESPERFLELHRRAAEAQKSLSPGGAVMHFMAAEAWEEAAQSIEQASEEYLRRGFLRTIRVWIKALPVQVYEEHPRLLYLLGWCAIQIGNLDEALSFLEAARNGYNTLEDPAGQGETLLLMIDIASRQHDYANQAALVQMALAFPLPIHGQVQLLMAKVWQSLFEGDIRQADETLDPVLALTLSNDDRRSFLIVAQTLNMHLAFLPGGTPRLEHYCRLVLSRYGKGPGLIQACAHALLGYILFLRGLLEDSLREVEQAQATFQYAGGPAYTEGQIIYTRGMVAGLRGDLSKAEELGNQILLMTEQSTMMDPYRVAVLYIIGRMQWMQHKVEKARQTAAQIAAISDREEFPETAIARQLMHALIEISDRRFADAAGILQTALSIERRWPHAALFGSPRMFTAYLNWQRRYENEAWAEFAPFLAECERRNTPGLILQEMEIAVPLLQLAIARKVQINFCRRLLDQLTFYAAPKPLTVPETGQTLTHREVEVLRLIAGGASNQVIAEQLVISQHTVKVHITNIFGKLNVSSRTQATARAHELGLF